MQPTDTPTRLPLEEVAALVLGAGLGTHLLPLTEHIPKPAIPLLGRPLIGHPLIHLYSAGCTRAWVNAFHHSNRLMTTLDAWVQRRLLRMKLGWSVETPEILGTGGALKKLEGELTEGKSPFLLLNGDAVLGLDLPAMWDTHQRNRREGALATLFCLPRADADRFGAVRVADDGRILDLAGLASRPGLSEEELAASAATIFCGVHIIEPEVLDHLPPNGTFSCIVRQGYAPLLSAGADIRAVLAPTDLLFHDVGTPDRYLDAQADLLGPGGERALAVAPEVDRREALFQEATYAVDTDGREYGNPDGVQGLAGAILEPPFFFGPGNSVGPGARIGPHASVGALCSIESQARVRDCALWSQVAVEPGEELSGLIASKFGGARLTLKGRSN
ncbi:MAG: NDP-sugar synthase [Myxococcota bacterium]|nr:NDP-sugar synthase [Myxococcota bacterium]